MNSRSRMRVLAIASSLSILAIASVQVSAQDKEDIDMCGFASSARFVESAPRDRFIVDNGSSAAWNIRSLNVDLSTSTGKLIFDITAQGAGVEVFQPFRDDGGTAKLAQDPTVADGDQSIMLIFSSFEPGDDYQFSIDIDDQLADSDLGQIRVSSGEIAGTSLRLELIDEQGAKFLVSGVFDTSNQVVLSRTDC